MRKYIGTKEIKATPMSIIEAYIKGLVRTKPALEDESNEGYLVEYEDGYRSWSPKDVFEKAYKVADTFKDRLIIEQQELEDRMLKLLRFINGDKFVEIVPELDQRTLLHKQYEHMGEYLDVLNQRIATLKD